MKKEVTLLFDARVRKVFHTKPTILRFLLKHERKDLFIDNLQKEIRVAEFKLGNEFDLIYLT